MPLPVDPRTPWPPLAMADPFAAMREHDAWYSGDPQRLLEYYSDAVPVQHKPRFWGREVKERRTMLHVPVAGDIAAKSAALLFSEAPIISIEDDATQERLAVLINEGGLHNRLLEAAEACSALGGGYLKPNWDKELAPYPLLSVAQADCAVPTFKFGMLTDVTFWRTLYENGEPRYRHLERYETDHNGLGVILNGVYDGTSEGLGRPVGLEAHLDTAGLLPLVQTQVKGLLCRYVPNMRPNRRFRATHPYLGQSDYAGVEGLMDSLDEAWTSWMRDLRLGQGRLYVPESFLTYDDKSKDFKFDLDEEAYVLRANDTSPDAKNQIDYNQFAIRTQEHADTTQALLTAIIQGAGYSPQAFGLSSQGAAVTATEIKARERASFLTRSKKERYWVPAIADMLHIMLQLDAEVFGTQGLKLELRPHVELADSITPDTSETAASVELLKRAQAASVKTRVKMLHPDWNDDQVDEEVQAIQQEEGASVPDPMQVGIE